MEHNTKHQTALNDIYWNQSFYFSTRVHVCTLGHSITCIFPWIIAQKLDKHSYWLPYHYLTFYTGSFSLIKQELPFQRVRYPFILILSVIKCPSHHPNNNKKLLCSLSKKLWVILLFRCCCESQAFWILSKIEERRLVYFFILMTSPAERTGSPRWVGWYLV